tara:strand:- start:1087 stop:1320 length:234 start_codon:yes stop_codon:yes gene_type:complete
MSDKNEFPISDSTFLLSAFAILGACVSTFLTFILKSRCTEISCCGIRIIRDVIPADQIVQMEQNRQVQAEASVVTRT